MTKERTGFPSVDRPWLKYYNEAAINGSLPECSIYEYLCENNRDYPNDVAIIYLGKKITYRELFENIERTAAAFVKAGVKEKEIVTVALPSIPEAVYCVYALNKIGAVANMIHPLAGKEETVLYINEVRSKVVVVFDGAYNSTSDIISKTTAEKVIVASPGDSLPITLRTLYFIKVHRPKLDGKIFSSWKEFIRLGKSTVVPRIEKDYNELALISHTGGTTGEPKGVMCSDYSLIACMLQIVCNFKFGRGGCSLMVLPPFVNYSIVEAAMAMLNIGYRVAMIPKYVPKEFPQYVRKYKPSVVLSIPAYWCALLELKTKTDMSCLEHIYYGGEGMSEENEVEINRYLSECGVKVQLCKGLGCTEMVAGATQSYSTCNPIGSVGIPLVKTNCRIENPETDIELSYNEQGEICFSGPSMMMGYYDNPDATDEIITTDKDGTRWLHTGDIGYIDVNGILYVTGRIKRIIMTKGRDGQVTKMFPDRIEKVICSIPEVELCCVIGVPDEARINYPKAFVVLKENDNATLNVEKDIINLCEEKLPEYMIPENIEFRSELPRTARGKIDYKALEER